LRQVRWIERLVRRADRFQRRHSVLASPWAEAVTATFTEVADEDPLGDLW